MYHSLNYAYWAFRVQSCSTVLPVQVCAAPKRRFGAYSGPKGNNTKAAMDERYEKLQAGRSGCELCTSSVTYSLTTPANPLKRPSLSLPAWKVTLMLFLTQGQWVNRRGPHSRGAIRAGRIVRLSSDPVLIAALPRTLIPAVGQNAESV